MIISTSPPSDKVPEFIVFFCYYLPYLGFLLFSKTGKPSASSSTYRSTPPENFLGGRIHLRLKNASQ